MVKWTPEKDQLLLLKILETHELSVDAKRVSAAWPAESKEDIPTPRAITERLVKIRQQAKANGAKHFAIASVKTKGSNSSRSVTGLPPVRTPRKQVAAPSAPGSSTNVVKGEGALETPGKRKMAAAERGSGRVEDEEDDNDVMILNEPPYWYPNQGANIPQTPSSTQSQLPSRYINDNPIPPHLRNGSPQFQHARAANASIASPMSRLSVDTLQHHGHDQQFHNNQGPEDEPSPSKRQKVGKVKVEEPEARLHPFVEDGSDTDDCV